MNIALRKAYKLSCELSSKISNGSVYINQSSRYNVYDELGDFATVVKELHEKQEQDFQKNLEALEFVNELRLRIQNANNKPLSYTDGLSINLLISRQATLNSMIKFIPDNVEVINYQAINASISTQRRRLEDKENLSRMPSSYSNPDIPVSGSSEDFVVKISEQRLQLRSELESVTSKLAYANITETVELSEKEAEILRNFKVPV